MTNNTIIWDSPSEEYKELMTERARKLPSRHPNKSKKKHVTHRVVTTIPAKANQIDQIPSKPSEPARPLITKKAVTYHFEYVVNDIKRIGIVTGIMVVIIIVLTIIYQ